jgi:DNA-binding MarR family transcriptional regulator
MTTRTRPVPAAGDTAAGSLGVIEAQLRRLLARARAWSVQTAAAVHPELDPALYAVLMEIAANAPVRSVDLATCRGVTKSVISRQVAALTELGLVARRPDAHDARAFVIELTDEGHRAAETADAARRAYLQRIFDGVSPADLDRIASSLTVLNDALD